MTCQDDTKSLDLLIHGVILLTVSQLMAPSNKPNLFSRVSSSSPPPPSPFLLPSSPPSFLSIIHPSIWITLSLFSGQF